MLSDELPTAEGAVDRTTLGLLSSESVLVFGVREGVLLDDLPTAGDAVEHLALGLLPLLGAWVSLVDGRAGSLGWACLGAFGAVLVSPLTDTRRCFPPKRSFTVASDGSF